MLLDRRDPRPAGRCSRRGSTASRRAALAGAARSSTTAIPSRSERERIRLRGIDAPEFDQTCRKDGADYPCGRRAREALVRADRRPAGRHAPAGSATATAGCSRLHGRRRSISTAARSRPAGRSPMATTRPSEAAAPTSGAGLWAGSFERPRDWRDEHGGMAESEHDCVGQDPQLAAARCFGFS